MLATLSMFICLFALFNFIVFIIMLYFIEWKVIILLEGVAGMVEVL